MSNYLSIANSPIMWLSCFPLVLLVLCQAVLYTRRAFATAVKMGISKSDCVKAFRAGMISAIGPSVAVFIMMVGLMSAVGSPVSWMRLSVMGAAAGEMINAGLGAQAVGIAQGAIDEAVKFTKERIQFGRRISQFQNTQFTLADMQTRTDAARMLVWRAAAAEQEGQPYTHLAAMAKLFASETASYVANRAVQLCGGYGYTKDYPVERMMRDAKVTEIYEGTSEVQRMVISGWMGVK